MVIAANIKLKIFDKDTMFTPIFAKKERIRTHKKFV